LRATHDTAIRVERQKLSNYSPLWGRWSATDRCSPETTG